MNKQMDDYIKEHELGVSEIKRQIEEARNVLNSGSLISPRLKEVYERLIVTQENQLKIVIENHKFILELSGMGE